jgi:hypothetical protein
MHHFLVLLLLLASDLLSTRASAEGPPFLTLTEGQVELFSDPSQKIHADIPEGAIRAKYEGVHYLARPLKAGAVLPVGAWLRTRPGARARVVFQNGDQMNVGPATLMRIEPPSKAGKDSGSMTLQYGLVRSILSKSGPRNRFKVRTASATMGVRGTDFVVEARATTALTALTLIRGEVELTKKSGGKAEVKQVKTGETALVEAKKTVQSFATSQGEFRRVLELTERTTTVTQAVEQPKKLRELEAMAREVTIHDLIDHTSTEEERAKVEALVQQSNGDAQALNRMAVVARIAQAPETSPGLQRMKEERLKRSKISGSELENLEVDPYGRYFEGTQTE